MAESVGRIQIDDKTGIAHPMGNESSARMRARSGNFDLLPSPDHILFMRHVDDGDDPEQKRTIRLAGELAAAGMLCDVLALVAQLRWKGELVVLTADSVRWIFLDGGNVVAAQSNVVGERVGEMLVKLGALTETQVLEIERRKPVGRRFGEAAVDLGYVTRDRLYELMGKQASEIVCASLQVDQGMFYLLDGFDDARLQVRHPVSAHELVMEGVRRLDELKYFRERIPNEEYIPVPLGVREEQDLSDELTTVFVRCDGKLSVREVGMACGLSEFEVTHAVFQLAQGGLLRIDAPSPTTPHAAVSIFNDAIREILRPLDSSGRGQAVRGTLQKFAASAGIYEELFHGAGPQRDGALTEARVAQNLARFQAEDRVAMLCEWLFGYLEFALFAAAAEMTKGAHRDLAKRVRKRMEVLAPKGPRSSGTESRRPPSIAASQREEPSPRPGSVALGTNFPRVSPHVPAAGRPPVPTTTPETSQTNTGKSVAPVVALPKTLLKTPPKSDRPLAAPIPAVHPPARSAIPRVADVLPQKAVQPVHQELAEPTHDPEDLTVAAPRQFVLSLAEASVDVPSGQLRIHGTSDARNGEFQQAPGKGSTIAVTSIFDDSTLDSQTRPAITPETLLAFAEPHLEVSEGDVTEGELSALMASGEAVGEAGPVTQEPPGAAPNTLRSPTLTPLPPVSAFVSPSQGRKIPVLHGPTMPPGQPRRRRRTALLVTAIGLLSLGLGVLVVQFLPSSGKSNTRVNDTKVSSDVSQTATPGATSRATPATAPVSARDASPGVSASASSKPTGSANISPSAMPSVSASVPASVSAPPALPSATPVASSPGNPARTKTGLITTPAASKGFRIFVDGKVAGEGGASIVVGCGSHVVKVGSAGTPQNIEVPCGGEISVAIR